MRYSKERSGIENTAAVKGCVRISAKATFDKGREGLEEELECSKRAGRSQYLMR